MSTGQCAREPRSTQASSLRKGKGSPLSQNDVGVVVCEGRGQICIFEGCELALESWHVPAQGPDRQRKLRGCMICRRDSVQAISISVDAGALRIANPTTAPLAGQALADLCCELPRNSAIQPAQRYDSWFRVASLAQSWNWAGRCAGVAGSRLLQAQGQLSDEAWCVCRDPSRATGPRGPRFSTTPVATDAAR